MANLVFHTKHAPVCVLCDRAIPEGKPMQIVEYVRRPGECVLICRGCAKLAEPRKEPQSEIVDWVTRQANRDPARYLRMIPAVCDIATDQGLAASLTWKAPRVSQRSWR